MVLFPKDAPKSPPKSPPKAPEPPKEEPKKEFFGKKGLTRPELRQALEKDPGEIPGKPRSKWYTREQRKGLEKKFDFKKYGGIVTRQETKHQIKKLQEEIRYKPWDKEKEKTEDFIKFLQKKLK